MGQGTARRPRCDDRTRLSLRFSSCKNVELSCHCHHVPTLGMRSQADGNLRYIGLAYYFHIHVRCPPDSGLAASADEEIKQCGSKTAVDKVEDDVLQHGSKLTLLEVNTTACERLFSLGCVSTPCRCDAGEGVGAGVLTREYIAQGCGGRWPGGRRRWRDGQASLCQLVALGSSPLWLWADA